MKRIFLYLAILTLAALAVVVLIAPKEGSSEKPPLTPCYCRDS